MILHIFIIKMIPSYTRKYLSMNVCGSRYFLPFEVDVKDDEILEKTMKLFTDNFIYERELYTDRVRKPSVSLEANGKIIMKCLYEGHDDYYPFSITLTVFRLNDENNEKNENNDKKTHDKKWMVSIYIEHCEGGLLDELIDIKTMPEIISSLGLNKYSYFS